MRYAVVQCTSARCIAYKCFALFVLFWYSHAFSSRYMLTLNVNDILDGILHLEHFIHQQIHFAYKWFICDECVVFYIAD